MITLKNNFRQLILCVFAAVFFLSCQKDIDHASTDFQFPDFTTKINSSVSGFVTDENDAAVMGASVKFGNMTTNTDKYGFFEVKNTEVVKTAAVVTVSKNGYFKGIKTYAATTGKAAFFRIKLIPKTNVGNVSGSTGGNVTLGNGLIISLPADAVVNAATNAVYTGTVNVAAFWINPTADDLDRIMPGDLRGIDESGSMKGLTTYGMAAVELTGASGELLQIATGKKATLTIPLPTTALATAPSSIPLWYFDEAIGLWKQEGTAIKTGNTYVGEVSHFSYWNCDLLNAIVPLTFTVVDAVGNPLGNIYINIVPLIPNSWGHIGGYTDLSGYVSVFVTPNTQYSLTLYSNCSSGGSSYSQTFSVGTTAVSLGNIIIPTSITATVTGTVTGCNNNPVTNGYIVMQDGYQYSRHTLDNAGAYSFSTVLCNAATGVIFIGEDLATAQQSTPLNQTLVVGNNVIGNLQACGITTQEFITYSIDGGTTSTTLTAPSDSMYHSGNGSTVQSTIFGNSSGTPNSYVNFSFVNTGIGVGTTQNLLSFYTMATGQGTTTGTVNITEYGAVGQFISGNITGTVINSTPTTYNIVCSFRVRRNF